MPNVYGGTNMPTGYTASALISVWATTASSQFVIGYQKDRQLVRFEITTLTGSSLSSTYNPVSLSGAVPVNAKTASGMLGIQATAGTGGLSMNVASDSTGVGRQGTNGSSTTANGISSTFKDVLLATPQLIYFNGLVSGPTAYTENMVISGYSI